MARVHLIDGTFELFRCFFGAPAARAPDGREVGAVRGLLRSLHALIRSEPVTHGGAAFDTVIESFRNDLFAGYKTGAGLPPELTGQFALAEEAAAALGLVVWGMIEFEADDAIAAAAALCADEPAVEQVVIVSPDKDFGQCVRGRRVICLDRPRRRTMDEEGVAARFGVGPASIPDYLALVGDDADGIPGLPGWGPRSSSLVLARHRHLDAIPADPAGWGVPVRGARALAETLVARRDDALLYRRLATLRTDVPLGVSGAGDLAWRGARRELLEPLCRSIGDEGFLADVTRWQD
ncbi:MAG TPA: 5'-3' exonuclease H3TH domain-containing protein [Kofleriaceae bacterium]|nr:5'-3' exonuclease H3TH domain-containing protein [Kofleriaceae bacterium]